MLSLFYQTVHSRQILDIFSDISYLLCSLLVLMRQSLGIQKLAFTKTRLVL